MLQRFSVMVLRSACFASYSLQAAAMLGSLGGVALGLVIGMEQVMRLDGCLKCGERWRRSDDANALRLFAA